MLKALIFSDKSEILRNIYNNTTYYLIVDYDLDPIEEEEPKSRKILLIVIGIFLIILILSWTFLSYPVGKILQGQARSTKINNNTLELKDFKIVFLNNTEKVLSDIYNNEQEKKLIESSVCLLGNKRDQDYVITSIYYPEIYEQSFMHVTFSSCPIDTLIMLHTHPYKHCLASDTDLDTLGNAKNRNSDVIMIVMCESERYSIYE
jgi:hypothetical protein